MNLVKRSQPAIQNEDEEPGSSENVLNLRKALKEALDENEKVNYFLIFILILAQRPT